MKANPLGNYFEDIEVGAVIHHELSKTITESDNNLFSLLTMNYHPVHLNAEYAKAQQHGEILVVGTLVFSLSVGITVPDISGKAIANLGYSNILHLEPVFINDTIYVKSEILEKKASKSKPDRGIIVVQSTAYNQNKQEILSFERTVLIKRKEIND